MDAYTAFADPALVLPVQGRQVRIPPPSARVGLDLRYRTIQTKGAALNGREELDAITAVLGETLYQELADTLPEPFLLHVGRTAILHFAGSPESGENHWDIAAAVRKRAATEPTDPSSPGYLGPDDPGGGPIVDAAAGVRMWFNPQHMAPGAQPDLRLTWRDIFDCWDDVILDLHETFGVDLHSTILDERPITWLELRVRDVALKHGSRLNRTIVSRPPKD